MNPVLAAIGVESVKSVLFWNYVRIVNKGASGAQNALAASQTQFYNTLTQSYAQQFAGQNAILSSLQKAWGPILADGPNQTGFSGAETAALNSQATEGVSQAYSQAAKAVAANFAAAGGGNEFLPSGASTQAQANVATAGANQLAAQRLGILQSNYAQGRANFQAATNALTGAAQLYNPTGYISGANTAGSDAGSTLSTIYQENAASSPWSAIGGILGGAATAGLNAFTGGIGGSLASGLFKGTLDTSTDPTEAAAGGGGDQSY